MTEKNRPQLSLFIVMGVLAGPMIMETYSRGFGGGVNIEHFGDNGRVQPIERPIHGIEA